MKQMKYYGMDRAFRMSTENGSIPQMTSDEMISLLITTEWDDRNNRRIEKQMRNARFRYKANINSCILI